MFNRLMCLLFGHVRDESIKDCEMVYSFMLYQPHNYKLRIQYCVRCSIVYFKVVEKGGRECLK